MLINLFFMKTTSAHTHSPTLSAEIIPDDNTLR